MQSEKFYVDRKMDEESHIHSDASHKMDKN